jgi:hypothetical protein
VQHSLAAGRCAAATQLFIIGLLYSLIIIMSYYQEYCSKPLSGEMLVVIIQSDITEPRSGETGLSV